MRSRLAIVGLFIALPAAATVVIAQTFEEMARTSPLVVRAKVGQVQSTWNERHTAIETWAELQVTEVLKGKTAIGGTLMVRNPGGIVGGIGTYVSGAPQFATGEDALLFLEPARDAQGVWLVSALAAGKVTFQHTPLGAVRAMRDLRGIAFAAKGAHEMRRLEKIEDLGAPDEFLARIRKAVAP
jgi:hypothetical protein